MTLQDPTATRAGTSRVPRSRGAVSGLLLVIFGAWGALIPFIGPYFHFGYTDVAWQWTNGRGWLEVLPGAVAAVAGLMMLLTATRALAVAAGWLASVAGAWFIVGPVLNRLLHIGSPGTPLGASNTKMTFEELSFFSGIGAVILFIGALGLGRLSVRSVRDLRFAMAEAEAERREAALAAQRREAGQSAERRDGLAERRDGLDGERPAERTATMPAAAGAGATGMAAGAEGRRDRMGRDEYRDDVRGDRGDVRDDQGRGDYRDDQGLGRDRMARDEYRDDVRGDRAAGDEPGYPTDRTGGTDPMVHLSGGERASAGEHAAETRQMRIVDPRTGEWRDVEPARNAGPEGDVRR
jgi:hypothetical protein